MSAQLSPRVTAAPRAPLRSALDLAADMPPSPPPLPVAPKRRAFSVSADQRPVLPRGAAARRAVSSAFHTVRTRLGKSSSMSSVVTAAEVPIAPTDAVEDPTMLVTTSTTSKIKGLDDGSADDAPPRSYSWKLRGRLPSVPAPLRSLRQRATSGATMPAPRRRPVPWKDGHVQYVTSAFALHGEDASAVSSYYHIVADGISAPFAGKAGDADHERPAAPVSSIVIARELIACVEAALEDLSNRNKCPIDAPGLEQAVTEAVRLARIRCFGHRASRIAATLCVAYFDRWNSRLHAFTLGDSKCVVFRGPALVFESTATVREFNVPCVVNLVHPLAPSDYVVESCDLLEGDVCMTFSDGIGDNLYKDDLLGALATADDRGLQHMSDALVAACRVHGPIPELQLPVPPSSTTPTTTTTMLVGQSDPARELDDPDADTTPTSCTTAMLLLERLDSAPTDDDEDDDEDDDDDDDARANPSAPNAPEIAAGRPTTRRFYPFATAAAYEYRRRVLKQRGAAPQLAEDEEFAMHLRKSAALLELHDGRSVLDRQVVVAKPNRRPHYSLAQLQRMAKLAAPKPDDVTLLITRFGC